jgi:hypothetical protein
MEFESLTLVSTFYRLRARYRISFTQQADRRPDVALSATVEYRNDDMSQHAQRPRAADIGTITIDADITLRRIVAHPAGPKGTVLLLHGFPETLHA